MPMEIIKITCILIFTGTFWQKAKICIGKTSGKANIEKIYKN
jgi:hypothetical protein